MRSWLFFLLLVAAGMLASGCATPGGDDVSTIPWNRPQSWEGGGALGSIVRPPGSP
jgi:hypothetical protein